MSQISTRVHSVSLLKAFPSDGARNPSPFAGFTFMKNFVTGESAIGQFKILWENGCSNTKHRENEIMYYLMIKKQ